MPRLCYVPETAMPFLYGNTAEKIAEMPYKIYNDGGHFVATVITPKTELKKNGKFKKPATEYTKLFKYLYRTAIDNGFSGKELFENILNGFKEIYPYYANAENFINEKLENESKNIYYRKKRLKRKANLNEWNYFCTFTYDGNKLTEDEFKKKLRKCLSNLHTRHKWRYMGVWERSPINKRLHFHAIMYVPNGEMVGTIRKQEDYSTASHNMQTAYINDFFESRFGRNDFKELNKMELRNGNAMNYLLKYVGKTNERIVYCRGVRSEIVKYMPATEIVSEYEDFVKKYVLFDDSISWEKDVMHFVQKQMCMFDVGNRYFAY